MGDGPVSLALGLVIVALVAYVAVTRDGIQPVVPSGNEGDPAAGISTG